MNALDRHTEHAVRRFMARIAGDHPAIAAIVYGSRARGTHDRDSDADVAVLLDGAPQRLLPVKLSMSDAAFDILLETGVNISPLPIWRDEWEHPERSANPGLLRNIAREGIRL